MKPNLRFRKTLAWMLIATMANPFAAISPAFARDTDIFLATTTGNITAEPNVLIVLDTSDSMNIPEPWREYPGAYDSHVEYLRNDINVISNAAVAAENAGAISTAAAPASPFSIWGTWAGADLAARQALWTAARNHANATEPGDPGPRNVWRNYNDASWLYWVPAQSPATASLSDIRLNAHSFNRFRASQHLLGGSRGGINFSVDPKVAGVSSTDYSNFNACSTSVAALTPSTVFRPTSAAKNAGYFANQQWARYERFLGLVTVNNGSYPGDSTITSGYARGYLDSSIAPPNVPARDNGQAPGSGSPGSLGLPIRVVDTSGVTFSHAGWTDLKADLGGLDFLRAVEQVSVYPTSVLTWLRANIYNYPLIGTEIFSALKGNRDASTAPAFGLMTGAGAYYQSTPSAFCNAATGPASGNCINVPSTCTSATATQTRSCVFSAAGMTSENDASGALRFQGGSCTNGVLGVCNDPGSIGCNPVPNCGFTTQNTFETARSYSCGWVDRQAVAVNTCQWSGRTGDFVEGQGWYHYGGTCSENGSTASCVAGGVTATVNGEVRANVTGPRPNPFVASHASEGCTNHSTRPAGTYYHGGTCQGFRATVPLAAGVGDNRTYSGPATANCTVAATAVAAIRGDNYTNVVHNSLGGCNAAASVNQTCGGRYRLACPTVNNATACPNQTSWKFGCAAGSVAANRFYRVYNRAAGDLNLVHDCKADEPAANPGGGSYMHAQRRNFLTSHNTAANDSTVASYTPSPANAIAADTTRNIDVYSVNYLNWKFGPKGPNGHPIGRKTRLQVAKGALTDLVSSTNGVRFGLMVFNRTSTVGVADGANVSYAIRRMGSDLSDPDSSFRNQLNAAILSTTASSRTPLTESLYEAYLYFSGRAPQWGTSTVAASGGGQVSTGRDGTAVCTAVGAGCPAIGVYRSPMLNNPTTAAPASCQKNFVVMITDGGPEDDTQADAISTNRGVTRLSWNDLSAGVIAARTDLDTVNPDTTTGQFEQTPGVPFGPKDLASNRFVWLDELSYFMSRADISPGAINFSGDTSTDAIEGRQSLTTYTIGFAGANSPVLQNAAQRSGGQFYIAEDSAALAAALLAAIASIQQWNPTIASPTIPLSELTGAQNSTDLYLSFFRPSTTQAWSGTVKKFMLADGEYSPGICGDGFTGLCIIGQNVVSGGNGASSQNIEQIVVDPQTGIQTVQVNPTASSFWGPSNLADAGIPDSGGTGYQLLNTSGYNPSTRKVYTWLPASTTADLTHPSNAVGEGNNALSKLLLGDASMSDAQRAILLNWSLGGNTGNAACSDADPATACTTWRAWAHGDVQHSRPAVATYDPGASPPSRYLFYTSTAGYLHAVDSNTGKEKWTFLIEEAFPQLSALMTNAAGQQIYVADGSPVVRFNDVNRNGVVDGSDSVWLFFGLRRGGRAYYALDITNPVAPRFMWKITPTQICTASGCAASKAYAELGESWSTPTVGRVRALADPVLVFGGGYDPNQDNRPTTAADSMGRAVFVTNARTGAREAAFTSATGGSMTFSMPSDPTAIDTDLDGNGYLDRIYIGDMGGRLWRFDIGSADKALWAGRLMANLSESSPTDRRIFFPPAAVKQFRNGVRYDAVIVGTGNRENPLKATTSDVIAMIKDTDPGLFATSTSVATTSNLLNLGSASDGTTDAALIDGAVNGWFRTLDTGEKVVNAPTVFFGRIRFGTYTPIAQTNACVPPGQGRSNELDLLGAYTLTVNSVLSRFDPGAVSRSYGSSGQLIVLPGVAGGGRRVFFVAAADARLIGNQQAELGAGTRVYWYTNTQN